MKSGKVRGVLWSACFCSGFFFSVMSSNAAAGTLVMATLNKGPMMDKVELEVKHARTNKVIERSQKHSVVLTLQPGDYIATIKAGNITRQREFRIVNSGDDNKIVIEMR